MVKIVTISGYKPYELGIFKQDHPAIPYIKKAIKEQLIVLLEEGLEVGHHKWSNLVQNYGQQKWSMSCENKKSIIIYN